MAENPEEPKQEEAPTGSNKKKLIIIIAIALVLIIGIGIGAIFFLKGSDSKSAHTTATTEEANDSGHGGEKSEEKANKEKTEDGKEEKEGEKKENGDGDKKEEHGKKEEGGHGEEKGENKAVKKDKEEGPNINFGATYAFKPFHLNLGNPLENRYVRLEVALEYKNGDDQLKEIEARKVQLRDAVIAVVSRKTREFLLGPDGKDQLRLEVLNRINQYMDRKIESVYITDLLIE